ncbi:MAG: hypothetical protein ACK42Z_02490, partial [Candidatus Kapaibacteriota bacterium]
MQSSLGFPILTWLVFLPIIGMLLVLLVPLGKDERNREVSHIIMRWITVVITFIQLILAIVIYLNYNKGLPGVNDASTFQFVERLTW